MRFVVRHLPEALGYWPAVIAITLVGGSALALRISAAAVGPTVAVHLAYHGVVAVAVYRFL